MDSEAKQVQIPEEDAAQLLRKWLDDDIPVSLRILAPGLSASLDGETVGEFSLEFSGVKVWNYRDVREATEEAKKFLAGRFASALQIQTDSFECVIYEIIESS
jgi:hypothetical protein